MRALPDVSALADSAKRRDAAGEMRLQSTAVEWVRAHCPNVFVFAIVQDGECDAREGSRRKWIGQVAGVPDLAIVGLNGKIHFIECKTQSGRLSDDQKAVLGRFSELSVPWGIVRSLEDLGNALTAWGVEFLDDTEENELGD